jgi:DNA polymerase
MKDYRKQEELEKLNKELVNCRDCHLCETRQQVLRGEGNLAARFFLVALSPGEQEDEAGRMFIGPAGKVLDELLEKAGIKRSEVYISNLIKCNLPQNRKPRMREIEACHKYLDEEIEIIQPGFIVPLGFYAGRYILEKYHAQPPSAKADYHELYGKLFYADGQKIYLLPHPASLLYKPVYYPQTQRKYNKLKTLSKECKWYCCCPMRRLYEEGKLRRRWIELYCHGDWESCQRYQMAERGEYHSDKLLPDGSEIKLDL